MTSTYIIIFIRAVVHCGLEMKKIVLHYICVMDTLLCSRALCIKEVFLILLLLCMVYLIGLTQRFISRLVVYWENHPFTKTLLLLFLGWNRKDGKFRKWWWKRNFGKIREFKNRVSYSQQRTCLWFCLFLNTSINSARFKKPLLLKKNWNNLILVFQRLKKDRRSQMFAFCLFCRRHS